MIRSNMVLFLHTKRVPISFLPTSLLMGLILILASISSAFANQDPFGRFVSEKFKVIVQVEEGARGGSEFISSRCKGKIFRPIFHDTYYEDKKEKFFVSWGGGSIHLDIEGSSQCFPEGRYKRMQQ